MSSEEERRKTVQELQQASALREEKRLAKEKRMAEYPDETLRNLANAQQNTYAPDDPDRPAQAIAGFAQDLASERDRIASDNAILAREQAAAHQDPWVHRSEGVTCSTCMWFVVKEVNQSPVDAQFPLPEKRLGRCRKYAPSAKGFVPVFTTDWCGDHRLDENKI